MACLRRPHVRPTQPPAATPPWRAAPPPSRHRRDRTPTTRCPPPAPTPIAHPSRIDRQTISDLRHSVERLGARRLRIQVGQQQIGAIERRLPKHRLRIDQQPRRAAGRQEIAQVRIPVHHKVRLRPRRKRAGEPHRFVDQPLRHRTPKPILLRRDAVRPAPGQIAQPDKPLSRGRRPAQPPQDGTGNIQRAATIAQFHQRHARRDALEQHRPARRIMREQTHRAIPVVQPQRVRLGTVLVIRERHFQHRRKAVAANAFQHQRMRAATQRDTGRQPPHMQQARHAVGQPIAPDPPGVAKPLLHGPTQFGRRQRIRRAGRTNHLGALRIPTTRRTLSGSQNWAELARQ